MPLEPSTTPSHVLTVSQQNYGLTVEENNWDLTLAYAAISVAPNNITSSTTTNFTSGNVLFANSGFVGSLSRSGIDTRTSFPNADVTAATPSPTAGTIVRRDSDGAVNFATSNTEGITLSVSSSGNPDNTEARTIQATATGTAGIAGDFTSSSGTAIIATSNTGTYHARFGNAGNNQSAIERVRGWFVWFYGAFTGRLKTADITANRDWTLPNASGTIALTTDIVDSVTSATTSDGTANLSISNVSTTTATVSGLLTAGHIHGNIAGTLYTHVRTGEAMSKGDPFYISGFHVGSSQPIAMKADASNAAKMPAVGVMDADYANNTSGANGIISGTLSSVNTNGYTVNSPIYVADGGGYSNTAGTIPQQVGITERDNANTGAFIVTSPKLISFADITDSETGTATLGLSSISIYPSGKIYYASTNSGGFVGLSGQLATDARDVYLPNASGNLALVTSTTGQIASADVSGLTALATTTAGANVENFLATPTSDNLASALTDENGTGGGFVRAQGATLTGPSLVGPVNLTSQDSSTADRVMNRGLADARYQTVSEFLVTSTASVFSSLINNSISGLAGPCYTVGYSAGTTASSRSGMIISTPCVVNTNTDYSYFSGTGQGSIIDFSIPWSVFFKLIFPRSVAGDDIIRIAVGDLFAGGITVPAFGCNGFGIRLNLKSGSSTIYEVRIIGKVRQGFEANFITGATNTSPINITCANHGLANGDFIEVVNVGGNTAANGIFQISNVTSTTFDLVGSSGNGAFTSNGAFSKITQPVEIVAGQSYDIKMRNTVSGSTYGCELSINGVVVLSLSGINRFHNLFNVRSGAGIRAAISNVSNPIASFYYLLTNIRFVQPM